MSYCLVVAEKPSVGAAYAKVLGATNRQDGYLEGNGYLVSWCVGHLVELAPPNVYDAKYVKWSIADLPILPQKWQYLVSASTKKQFGIEEMQERVNAATAQYHELGDSIKAAEQRMAEIAVLRAHIINYAKTRPVYDAYRKAGYSKKFLEEHREQITLHRAAKATFDEAGLKKLPKVKELNTEYSTLLSQKKAAYPAYRKARDEMQELMKAQKNVEIFFTEEKATKEKAQTR